MRALYRVRQFVTALFPGSSSKDLTAAARVLSPGQLLLFRSLPPEDQAHGLRVLGELRAQGVRDPDLLAAALLHDVGKLHCPLTVWERALVVAAQRFFPEAVQRWGEGEARGWRRAFVTALQHPEWGAEMVSEVGGSSRLIQLVRLHQHEPHDVADRELSAGLRSLQTADNWN